MRGLNGADRWAGRWGERAHSGDGAPTHGPGCHWRVGPLGRLEGAGASASARALTCWQAGPGVSGRESARGRARRGASARGLCGTLGCSGSRPVRLGPEREGGRWRRVGLRRASGLQTRREREGKLGPRGVWVGFPGQFGLSLAGLGLGFSFLYFLFSLFFFFSFLLFQTNSNHTQTI